MPKIIFLKAVDNPTKLQRLCKAVNFHFANNENVLIAVPSNEAATYIDQLLWRIPEENFLPHAIVNAATKENVSITTSKSNVNQAQILFNLCPENHLETNSFQRIYEFLDLTHPSKEQLSRKRQEDYRAVGLPFDEA